MAVARILFGPGKMGIKHADRFNPIPIRFLAFLCAIVSHSALVRVILTKFSHQVQSRHLLLASWIIQPR